jgi:hypothetical protein
MATVSLRADCARCAALCCVALSFERSDFFAIDKPAGEACPNLAACGACRIHDNRVHHGFAGCDRYHCNGAGQRVTQDLFAGRSWQAEPKLLAPMMRAFGIMTRIHGLLALLEAARVLPLDAAEQATLEGLEAALCPATPWSPASLEAAPLADIRLRCTEFLRTLMPRLPH